MRESVRRQEKTTPGPSTTTFILSQDEATTSNIDYVSEMNKIYNLVKVKPELNQLKISEEFKCELTFDNLPPVVGRGRTKKDVAF